MEIKKTVKEWIEIFHSLFSFASIAAENSRQQISRVMGWPLEVSFWAERRILASGGYRRYSSANTSPHLSNSQ